MCRIRDGVALQVHHRAQPVIRDSHYRFYHRHRVPRTSSEDRASTAWKILASWVLTTMHLEILFRIAGYNGNRGRPGELYAISS